MVPALVPEREREHREHDEHHAHSGSFARVLQTIITGTATFLPAGTSIARPRFIADEIGGLINGGHFLLRPLKSPQSRKMEVPMPYLFWAVVPFELMKMWWDACERARETSTN